MAREFISKATVTCDICNSVSLTVDCDQEGEGLFKEEPQYANWATITVDPAVIWAATRLNTRQVFECCPTCIKVLLRLIGERRQLHEGE